MQPNTALSWAHTPGRPELLHRSKPEGTSQSQRSCILTLPLTYNFKSSAEHLSRFNTAPSQTCTPAGLGRYTEAEPLLRNAHRVLHESFSGAFEAVGEAKFYLSLLALVGARSEEQVKALDTSLMQVRAVTWVVGGVAKGTMLMQGA